MTPCPPVRNKVSSESNHIPVVTSKDNIPSNTVQTPVIDDKDANSDDHHVSIDILSDDIGNAMVQKKIGRIKKAGILLIVIMIVMMIWLKKAGKLLIMKK